MILFGVFKVLDGFVEQVGFVGFFYLMMGVFDMGVFFLVYGDFMNLILMFDVYIGDFGINEGVFWFVYVFDMIGMIKFIGCSIDVEFIELMFGQMVQLLDGFGLVMFEDDLFVGVMDVFEFVKCFVLLQIYCDEFGVWVFGFVLFVLGGFMVVLFVLCCCVWVKVMVKDGVVVLEYVVFVCGEDFMFVVVVDDFVVGYV